VHARKAPYACSDDATGELDRGRTRKISPCTYVRMTCTCASQAVHKHHRRRLELSTAMSSAPGPSPARHPPCARLPMPRWRDDQCLRPGGASEEGRWRAWLHKARPMAPAARTPIHAQAPRRQELRICAHRMPTLRARGRGAGAGHKPTLHLLCCSSVRTQILCPPVAIVLQILHHGALLPCQVASNAVVCHPPCRR
jgi:hypothetical protein